MSIHMFDVHLRSVVFKTPLIEETCYSARILVLPLPMQRRWFRLFAFELPGVLRISGEHPPTLIHQVAGGAGT